jgi:hypothetical protein
MLQTANSGRSGKLNIPSVLKNFFLENYKEIFQNEIPLPALESRLSMLLPGVDFSVSYRKPFPGERNTNQGDIDIYFIANNKMESFTLKSSILQQGQKAA